MGYKIEAHPDKLEAFANNIVKELAFLEEQADTLDGELEKIILLCDPEYLSCFSGVGNTADTSDNVIERLDKHERDIRNASNKLQEQDDILGMLYNLYDDYSNITGLGAIAMSRMKFFSTGITQYIKNAEGWYSVKNAKFLDDLSDVIDNSKYKNYFRGFMNPMFLIKGEFRNSPLSALLHKKITGFLPKDAVDFTNNFRGYLKGGVNELGQKISWKDVYKTGKAFGKSNMITTLLVSGGIETVGAGMTIADNYNKYGNNPEVLKRENAKAVGKAVNNTLWTTGGSVLGTVVGGAAGTFLGPAGTVVGGAIGGAVGGFLGEKASGLTAGVAETFALMNDDKIQKGIEGIRKIGGDISNGVEKVSKVANVVKDEVNKHINKDADAVKAGADKVKDTAENLLSGAKNLISNPFSFG